MSATMMMVVGTTSQSTIVAPFNMVAPVVGGSTVIGSGSVLSTTNGTWAGTGSITFTYQWIRVGYLVGDILGATSSTYTVAVRDASHTIQCRVTATSIYGSGIAYSNETAAVTATSVPLEYLVVGGGGGATALYAGAGGGGGGYVTATTSLALATQYVVTIGAGRATNQNNMVDSTSPSGFSTTFAGTTALGGGGGGFSGNSPGANGGCGGGGGRRASLNDGQQFGGTGSQGGNGGYGAPAYGNAGGGGGGGAGGNGQVGTQAAASTNRVGATGGLGAQWIDGNYYSPGGSVAGYLYTNSTWDGAHKIGSYGRGAGIHEWRGTGNGQVHGVVAFTVPYGYPAPSYTGTFSANSPTLAGASPLNAAGQPDITLVNGNSYGGLQWFYWCTSSGTLTF